MRRWGFGFWLGELDWLFQRWSGAVLRVGIRHNIGRRKICLHHDLFSAEVETPESHDFRTNVPLFVKLKCRKVTTFARMYPLFVKSKCQKVTEIVKIVV